MSKNWAGGSTRGWRRIREFVLARDRYRCRLQLTGCTSIADCVHHTRGRAATGDDPAYLEAACTPCNLKVGDPTRTATTPRAQPRTRWTSTTTAPSANSTTDVRLITGPPCAGKTWYARQHAKPGDLLLDQDDLGPGQMRHALATIHQHHGTVWVIRCCPGPAARAALAAQLGATHIHICPDTPTLMARAQTRPHPRRTVAAIRKWLARETAAAQGTPHRPRAQPRTRWTT